MYDKSMSWIDISDEVFSRSEAISSEFGPKLAKRKAVLEASEQLGRSEILVRRYLTADKSLSALLPMIPNATREDLGKLPFSTSEYIGRMRSLDEDLATQWLARALRGEVKVLEVRAAYEALAMALKAEGKDPDGTKRSEGNAKSTSIYRDHTKLVEFRQRAEKAVTNHFVNTKKGTPHTMSGTPLSNVLEYGPVYQWGKGARKGIGTYVSIPAHLFDHEEILQARLGRLAFSSLYFDEYWLVVQKLSTQLNLMDFIGLVDHLSLSNVGILVVPPKGKAKIIQSPTSDIQPRTIG